MTDIALRYAVEPRDSGPLVLGVGSDGDLVVVVGGQGSDYFLVSEDGGRTFESRDSPGRGLRSAWVSGNDVWVCGEYGYAAHSPDRGNTWHTIDTKTGACLFGVAVDARGQLLLAGDSGFLIRVDRSGEVEHIELTTSGFSRMSEHPDGVLLPSDSPGQLWLIGTDSVRKLAINAGPNLMKARVLDSGAIIAVGQNGQAFRSEDDGETFRPVEGGFEGLLCSVDALADGRVFIVGQGSQIWVSEDDGRSFTPVEHSFESAYFWSCDRVGDVLLVGAHNGAVLQIGEFRGAPSRLAPLTEAEIGPPQPIQPKSRPTRGRQRHRSPSLARYVSGGTLMEDVEQFLGDQPKARLPAVERDMEPVYACLGNYCREEIRTLLELYETSKLPALFDLEVRLVRPTNLRREVLVARLSDAYGEGRADALAATVAESIEVLAEPNGRAFVATHDGVWEWWEDETELRRVCEDVGTLYYLLVRAAAAQLGRFDRDELERELESRYDDWLDCEFFENSVV